jgi:hypothetical protein
MAIDPTAPEDRALVVADAIDPEAELFSVAIGRSGNDSITGFHDAAFVASVPYADAGMVHHPNGTLLVANWPANEIGQLLPGSTEYDRVTQLAGLGAAEAATAVAFVPAGFPGAGQLKLLSWDGGEWYTVSLTPDGNGLFTIGALQPGPVLPGGAAGMQYVHDQPGIDGAAVLTAEFNLDTITVWELDAIGDPLPSSGRPFLGGLTKIEGLYRDPLSGDLVATTWDGDGFVVGVRGFHP